MSTEGYCYAAPRPDMAGARPDLWAEQERNRVANLLSKAEFLIGRALNESSVKAEDVINGFRSLFDVFSVMKSKSWNASDFYSIWRYLLAPHQDSLLLGFDSLQMVTPIETFLAFFASEKRSSVFADLMNRQDIEFVFERGVSVYGRSAVLVNDQDSVKCLLGAFSENQLPGVIGLIREKLPNVADGDEDPAAKVRGVLDEKLETLSREESGIALN